MNVQWSLLDRKTELTFPLHYPPLQQRNNKFSMQDYKLQKYCRLQETCLKTHKRTNVVPCDAFSSFYYIGCIFFTSHFIASFNHSLNLQIVWKVLFFERWGQRQELHQIRHAVFIRYPDNEKWKNYNRFQGARMSDESCVEWLILNYSK